MIVTTRLLKQVAIAAIVILVLTGGGVTVRYMYRPPVATPTPDPRLALEPLNVLHTYFFTVNEKAHDYDFLARIQNPNATFGSGVVAYDLSFFDGADNIISTKKNTFYILPGQTKYIVDTPLRFEVPVKRAEMKITSIDWQELDDLALQGVDLVVTSEQFKKIDKPNLFGLVQGTVDNASDFDVTTVHVVVVLLDAAGIPLATNRTEMRTFLAHTTRGFETDWFLPVPGEIAKTYVEANTNLFENDTFIRMHGGKEQFQSF